MAGTADDRAEPATTLQPGPLTALCLGWFVVIVDATIVNVALPTMQHSLHANVSGLQWVIDAYTVTFAGLLLSGGFLADRLGARRIFIVGLGVFAVASGACALAPGLGTLIAARAVQGVGAALLVPACLSLIQATYSDRVVRARAIGVWGTVGGLAAGVGPLLGGALTEAWGWRAMFWVNVPVVLVTVVVTRRFVRAGERPREQEHADRGFDGLGQLTSGVALVALTAGVVEAGRGGLIATVPIALLAVAVAAAVGFAVIEFRSAHPMLPPSLFADWRLSSATGVGFMMNFAFYGLLFVETLAVQRRYGLSPLMTGLAVLPQTAVIAIGSWLGGWVTSRIGPRVPMIVGMVCGAAGFFALTVLGPSTPYAALVGGMLASGFGISFCMPAATSAVVEAAPEGRAGIASGVLNASRQVGGAVGVALLGALIASRTTVAATLSGARIAMIVAGCAYVAGAVLAWSYRSE